MSVNVVLKSVFDDKGIKNAERGLEGLSKGISVAFAAIGAATVAAGIGITKFSINAAKSGSNLSESLNAVRVAYGDASEAIIKLGEDSAQRLGVTQTEFNNATVRFSAFADRIVGDGGNVAGFIDDITTRATDFASVFNIEVAEALQVFQSGLSGEAEPLKRFGINLLDSEVKAYAMAKGIGEVGKELTETEKVQARYGLLLQSTNKVQGDFANTSDGLANRQRILQASFGDLQAQIGMDLLPAFEGILGVVQDDLLPIIQDMAQEAGPALAGAFEFVAEVFKNAFTEGTELNTALNDLGGAFDLLFSAITNGQKDADGFADFLANLVRIIEFVTTTFASLIAGAQGFAIAMDALGRGDFDTVFKFLSMDTIEFMEHMEGAKTQTTDTAGEIQRFNEMRLDNAKSQLRGVSDEIMRMYHSGVAASAVFEGILDPRTGKGVDFTIPKVRTTTTTTTTTTTGPSAAEVAAEKAKKAFEKVQDIVKKTQKAIISAQEKYTTAVLDANQAYADGVAEIQTSFTNQLVGIVNDSKARLTDAFKNVASISIANILSNIQSKQSEINDELDDLKDKSEDAAKAFSKGQEQSARSQEKLNKALENGRISQTEIEDARIAVLKSTNSLSVAEEKYASLLEDEKATSLSIETANIAVLDAKNAVVKAQEKYNSLIRRSSSDSSEVSKARAEVVAAETELLQLKKEAEIAAARVQFQSTAFDPVSELVANLSEKVLKNRQIIETSAALASEGFSQTFIEQIVETGNEGGIALANSLLEATPETKDNVKALFAEVERQSETGLNALADQIYEKQGLATSELRALYEGTTAELYAALADQQRTLENSLRDAALELQDSLKDIKADYLDDIEELDGSFGGLKGTIDKVGNSLDAMIGKAGTAASAAASTASTAATNQIDFINQIKNASTVALKELASGVAVLSTALGMKDNPELQAAIDAINKQELSLSAAAGTAGGSGTSQAISTGKLQSNAMEAAALALGSTFNQSFVDALSQQVTFTKDGISTVFSKMPSGSRLDQLIAEGYTQVAKANIDPQLANLALNLAEQVYGVDLGALGGTPGQIGSQTTININVTADATQSPAMVGKAVSSAITKFVTTGGQVVVN